MYQGKYQMTLINKKFIKIEKHNYH